MQLPERFGNVVSSITKNHQFDSNGSKQPWINTAGHPSIGHKEAVDSEVRTWLVGKTNKQKKATSPNTPSTQADAAEWTRAQRINSCYRRFEVVYQQPESPEYARRKQNGKKKK
jgi:hypothetical protein